MKKKVTDHPGLTAAFKHYPETVWMGQLGYVNPYYNQRQGFITCWDCFKQKISDAYIDARKEYEKTLKLASKSGDADQSKVTYWEGKKDAYFGILQVLMTVDELNKLMKKKSKKRK